MALPDSQQVLTKDATPSCKGEEDGDYPYPGHCSEFVTCEKEKAHIRDCALCKPEPERCPEGRLVFDKYTHACLYANEAECEE